MLRDKNLIPLSHQHQHALSLCVRMDRAADGDIAGFQPEIVEMWENEIRCHFEAEEHVLFPAAAKFESLADLVAELLRDHQSIRDFVDRAKAKALDAKSAREFSATLSAHVRKEERQLFEECQRLMSAVEMDRIGAEVARSMSNVPGQSCAIRPAE